MQLLIPSSEEEDTEDGDTTTFSKKSDQTDKERTSNGGGSGGSTTSCINDEDEGGSTPPSKKIIKDNNNNNSTSSVMSDDLRHQFEAMKTVWRQAKRAESQESLHEGHNSQDCNEKHSEEDPAAAAAEAGSDLKRKAARMAVETALAVDQEISRWQNGIADLEALLAAEEAAAAEDKYESESDEEEKEEASRRRDGRRRRPVQEIDVPRFPILARVIPVDDEDDA